MKQETKDKLKKALKVGGAIAGVTALGTVGAGAFGHSIAPYLVDKDDSVQDVKNIAHGATLATIPGAAIGTYYGGKAGHQYDKNKHNKK